MNGFEIRPGKPIKANTSVANLRLFIGNIPKTKSREEIKDELAKSVEGVTDVIVYAPADEADKKRNRGFCFVDFDTHKNASAAKRKLANGRARVRSFLSITEGRFMEMFRSSIVILLLTGPIQTKIQMKIRCHK